MRLLVIFLILMVSLAGCGEKVETEDKIPTSAECLEGGLILGTNEDGDVACVEAPFAIESFEDPNHFCVVQKRADRVHAPDLVGNPWTLGQYWDYSLAVDGEDLGVTKLVYYEDQDFSDGVAQHYMVGTPTRDEALHHALFGENPMIGRVHRVLYSPHESGDHANMFNFPLCEGSNWSTVFYGEQFSLSASEQDISVPGMGTSPGFLIEGTSPEGSSLSLTYSPAAQWFTNINLQRGDGDSVVMNLEEIGQGYSGDAFFLRGQNDDFRFITLEAPAANVNLGTTKEVVEREDGGDGPYDTVGLHIIFQKFGAGSATFTIADPNGTEVWSHEFAPDTATTSAEQLLEVPYVAGDWTMDLTGAAVDAEQAFVFAHVAMVSIYDRSGSV